jgi:hypothetical protein
MVIEDNTGTYVKKYDEGTTRSYEVPAPEFPLENRRQRRRNASIARERERDYDRLR